MRTLTAVRGKAEGSEPAVEHETGKQKSEIAVEHMTVRVVCPKGLRTETRCSRRSATLQAGDDG